MILLKFYFYTMILFICGNANQKKITVIGKAENDKGEAYVVSYKDKLNYYVDNDSIYLWEDNIIGKTVKITGELFIQNIKPQKKGKEHRQEAVGIKRIILKPKWELVK